MPSSFIAYCIEGSPTTNAMGNHSLRGVAVAFMSVTDYVNYDTRRHRNFYKWIASSQKDIHEKYPLAYLAFKWKPLMDPIDSNIDSDI